METVGTYTGGEEPAIETRHAMVAMYLRAREEARGRVHAHRQTQGGGDAPREGQGRRARRQHANHDDAWMIKAARALSEGREPESTTAY